MKIIFGLGNDEGAYRETPHNIGFHAVDALARRWNLSWKNEKGRLRAAFRKSDLVVLAKNRSYMNVSGPLVKWACGRWKVSPENILVVCDDFALTWGRLRFRRSGRSGGHKGLESLVQELGTMDFPRLRVGVGPVPDGMEPKDFVLRKQPARRIEELAEKAADGLEAYFSVGLEAAMNRFNAVEASRPPNV